MKDEPADRLALSCDHKGLRFRKLLPMAIDLQTELLVQQFREHWPR